MGALVSMRQYYLPISLAMLAILSLTACTHPIPNNDFGQEHWRQYVDVNPNQWTRGADRWFFTGEPNDTELANRDAPYTAAMSSMNVRIPDIASRVRVKGDFQVQLYGTQEHANAYLTGPNAALQAVAVEVRGDTVYVHQTQPMSSDIMHQVIVRIGIKTLHALTQMGNGRIEAIGMSSEDLCIATTADACGAIYLAGRVNVKRVTQGGYGAITVVGANALNLDIVSTGSGPVNMSGNLGIRSITHHGKGNINIIGTNSYPMQIDTDGSGKIGIYGCANLKNITAKDNTAVYAYPIATDTLSVIAKNNARIGLSGHALNLSVETYNASRFEGRNLCAQNAYVKAFGASHINVTASSKIFASASPNSSVYFYGPANLLSSFPGTNEHVIAMGYPTWCNYNSEYRPYNYTYSHGRENFLYVYKVKRPVRAGYKDE
ncbi:MAG: hypothetical protein EPO11_01465 [Gammaproteobacteria bacterium]|nr:MAG: hypothetical protein EPO11_01465 [Gammaproteobacteria bacterium]